LDDDVPVVLHKQINLKDSVSKRHFVYGFVGETLEYFHFRVISIVFPEFVGFDDLVHQLIQYFAIEEVFKLELDEPFGLSVVERVQNVENAVELTQLLRIYPIEHQSPGVENSSVDHAHLVRV